MPSHRKLGRPTDQRLSILRNLVTAFIQNGRIETTEKRAKEVQKIVDSLIASAAKESDNFTSKQIKVTRTKLDKNGKKMTVTKESKNGNKYEVMDKETTTEMVQVDNPSRLAARKAAMKWINKVKDEAVVNKLFDEIGPKYKDRTGGYTRLYRLGARRGDAAEMAVLELV